MDGYSSFMAGMVLSLSLIMAIGPQNAHVLRMGLQRSHLWLTVGVSIVADVVLIGLGVYGLAALGGLSEKLHGALVGGGVVFLLVYGTRAARRFFDLSASRSLDEMGASGCPSEPAFLRMGWRQAVLSALAFSWLNPHAWLDTAVLIGTASLAYGTPGNTFFGLGAVSGSAVWFLGLGVAVGWLGRRIGAPGVWRMLDGGVALMMWGTAVWLLAGLV